VFYKKSFEGEEEEESIPCQISPVFKSSIEISNSEYELVFLVSVPALGLQTYYIRNLRPGEGENRDMSVANIKIFNSKRDPFQASSVINSIWHGGRSSGPGSQRPF
jgi:hypothetical protein